MRRPNKAILTAAGMLALSACTDGSIGQTWYKEAGSQIDEGGFGNPTMNNTLVQSGELDYVINLNQRFASDVPTMITFAFDSAMLDANARAVLMRQADWIKQFPEVRFRVYGHTDLVGSAAYNKNLGLRRAQAAVAFLTSQGISRSRLEAIVSFGETQPLIATADRERRNRRTVTEVSGFVRNHPTLLHGKYAQVIFRNYIRGAGEVQATNQSQLAGPQG